MTSEKNQMYLHSVTSGKSQTYLHSMTSGKSQNVPTFYDLREEPDVLTLYDLRKKPDVLTLYDLREEPDVLTLYDLREKPDVLTLYDLREEPDVVDAGVHGGSNLPLGRQTQEDAPLGLGLNRHITFVTVLLHDEVGLFVTATLRNSRHAPTASAAQTFRQGHPTEQ